MESAASNEVSRLYYHVSDVSLSPGQALQPGRWWAHLLNQPWRTGECDGCEDCFDVYVSYVVEMLFEEVRMEVNPGAPSRRRSLFVWPELCCAEWFQAEEWREGARIYAVELRGSGPLFEGDYHLLESSRELPEIRESARRYWSGEGTGNHEWELVWTGSAIVCGEVA